jgi:hypothetical protein
MKPSITITRNTISDLELFASKEALALPEDEFIALVEDSIKLLQSQLLSIQQAE